MLISSTIHRKKSEREFDLGRVIRVPSKGFLFDRFSEKEIKARSFDFNEKLRRSFLSDRGKSVTEEILSRLNREDSVGAAKLAALYSIKLSDGYYLPLKSLSEENQILYLGNAVGEAREALKALHLFYLHPIDGGIQQFEPLTENTEEDRIRKLLKMTYSLTGGRAIQVTAPSASLEKEIKKHLKTSEGVDPGTSGALSSPVAPPVGTFLRPVSK